MLKPLIRAASTTTCCSLPGSTIALSSVALSNVTSQPKSSCRCGCSNSSSCSCSCCAHRHHYYYPARPATTTTGVRAFSTTTSSCSASTMAAVQEYKLKGISSLSTVRPFDKIEAEVEGVQDGKVLVLRHDGQIRALGPKCTHYGAPLKNGVVTPDGRLTCPWHGGMVVTFAFLRGFLLTGSYSLF